MGKARVPTKFKLQINNLTKIKDQIVRPSISTKIDIKRDK